MWTLTGAGEWPAALKPRFDDWGKHAESADQWFARCPHAFDHLDPRVLEQWLFRHWHRSPYHGLPLESAFSEEVLWTGEKLLHKVESINPPRPGDNDAANQAAWLKTWEAFAHMEPHKTMSSTGTWDFPILVAHAPSGVRVNGVNYPDARYWLIEGQKRLDHLMALRAVGSPDRTHAVLLLHQQREVA